MPSLNLTQRRSAAYMTLSEVTQGEQLMRAMWMLEERDQSADKMTFIGFFGITAELLGINSSIITTLYPKLNRNLDLPKQELVDDPMPKMLAFRGINTASQETVTNEKVVAPTKQKENAPDKTKGTPEMSVFAAFISKVASEAGYPKVESYNIFNEVFKEEIEEARVYSFNREQIISWVDALDIKVFKRNIDKSELSLMVHCMYVALCEAHGPVRADEIAGESLFLRKLVLGIPAQASGKNLTRPLMPSAPQTSCVRATSPLSS